MGKKSELIQVGEMAVGFSENVLPDTDELKGKSIKLFFENGSVITYQFHDKHSLTWKTPAEGDDENYRATCPRNNIFFVDYIKKNAPATSVSIISAPARLMAIRLSIITVSRSSQPFCAAA